MLGIRTVLVLQTMTFKTLLPHLLAAPDMIRKVILCVVFPSLGVMARVVLGGNGGMQQHTQCAT